MMDGRIYRCNMNLLTIENLTHGYSERQLFEQANFSVHQGEKIGVIGVNGMGKSTLLKIIANVVEQDSGKITCGNHVKIGYLAQSPEFEPKDTVLSAALKGNMEEKEDLVKESQAKSLLNKLGLYEFDQLVNQLSGGQKKRVALVNVMMKPVDILILDEPTNHLDNQMSDWLEEYLINYKGCVIMVTHDRYFLDRIVTRIVEVDRGKIYSYPGNYSEFVRLKEERQNMEFATERKRQSLLRTELEWLARGARARSTKQKAHIQRIEDMQAVKAPVSDSTVEINSMSSRMGRKTIEVSGLCKQYGQKILIKDYEYIFLKGERIGIIGPNGCGKSTFLKMINGVVTPDAGTIEIGQTVKIGYFSQENEYMDESMKAIEYIREGGEYIQTTDGKITASMMMERFLFDGTQQWTYIHKLSGGEKRRLYLLRILMESPNVLILDEPTNDLDIQTLTILEDYLDTFDGIVIAVSHDRYFLDRVVRRIFAFENDGLLKQYEGGYSDYLLATDHKEQEKSNAGKKEGAKEKYQKERTKKLKFTYLEEKEYQVIDEELEALEEIIAKLEGQMQEYASSYSKLSEIAKEKEEAEQRLEEKMERWVYLNELAQRIEEQNEKK